jgi:WD40 repeat protein
MTTRLSPFKFLDSYTKEDRDIFFGRDREIEELYQKVFESKLMLVYGVSGTGKSSLIHCGLANKFQETDWLPLIVRRGGNIIESTASVIKAASITPQDGQCVTPVQFKKAVRSLYLDHYKPVIFIFDQFEELFIFGSSEEKLSFIQVVRELINSDIQCHFIFVLREEYLAHFTEFEKYVPTILANRVRIEKMSRLNALKAIKEPCNVFKISLEDGFAETLLEKLGPGSTEVELTYLQVFLDRIYRLATNPFIHGGETKEQATVGEKESQPAFTNELLEKSGNVTDLLGNFLIDQISTLNNPEMAMTVLKGFVSGKGTKRPANESETIENVNSLGKEISAETVTELLQTFVRLRVLRDKDNNGRYELRHDALAGKIYEKFSLAEKELLEIRQLIENGYQYYVKRKILLSNDDLAYISNKDSLLNLNSELLGFLQDSREHQLAKIRTVRRLTVISAVAFVVLLAILGYFVNMKVRQVKADYLAIKSISQITNPIIRLRVAGQKAWRKNPGALPKEALIKAFNDILLSQEKDSVLKVISNLYSLKFDPAPINIQYAESSKDNKYIFGFGDSLIFIWNAKGHLEKTIRTDHFPLIDIKISDDGSFIGAVSNDSLLTVWSVTGELKFSYRIQYNRLNTKQMFKFTRDNRIVALSAEHDAVLLDRDGKVLQAFDRHKRIVNAVDISPDNNFIATASSDTTINIWYLNSVKNRFDFYNKIDWHSDTIWSVSFSGNNIRVVSASADSTIVIGTINNHWEYYQNANQRICYADFSASDRGAVLTSYLYKNHEVNKSFYGLNYHNPKINISNLGGEENQLPGEEYSGFSTLVFSGDENYFACTQKNNIYLVDNKMAIEKDWMKIVSTYMLLKLTGTNPFFSSDSKYLLYIDQNIIRSYLIDIETINKAAWTY